MAGEITVAASIAALKTQYPDGRIPASINSKFRLWNRIAKKELLTGEKYVLPIQNAFPQGSSGTVANAQTAAQQSNYARFEVTRVKHYGVARVAGDVVKVASGSAAASGAMADLWKTEMDGAATTESIALATYLYGTGDGTMGQLSAGATTTSITMAANTNMNYFALGMLVSSVSAVGLSPTVRGTQARIVGLDRINRTITLSAGIAGQANTDYLCRFGDTSAGGANASVPVGLGEWLRGGATPGTLFGLNRTTDPVAFAGQAIDYSGQAIEDAVMQASASQSAVGIGDGRTLVLHPIEYSALRRSQAGKVTIDGGGGSATAGFAKVTIEGDNGPIEIISDPFCPRFTGYLLDLPTVFFNSGKCGAPHIQDYDGQSVLRLPTEDVYEARWATYGNLCVANPGANLRLINVGV